MIAFLEGEVAHKAGTRIVLDVNGIGYDVLVPASTVAKLPPVGKRARVHTRMVVANSSWGRRSCLATAARPSADTPGSTPSTHESNIRSPSLGAG